MTRFLYLTFLYRGLFNLLSQVPPLAVCSNIASYALGLHTFIESRAKAASTKIGRLNTVNMVTHMINVHRLTYELSSQNCKEDKKIPLKHKTETTIFLSPSETRSAQHPRSTRSDVVAVVILRRKVIISGSCFCTFINFVWNFAELIDVIKHRSAYLKLTLSE